MSSIPSLLLHRELANNLQHNGCNNRDMQLAAEEKAASCEMEEISCQMLENTRATFLVTFSPDGTKVASAHGNHKIYVSDIRTGKHLHTLEGHPRTPWCIAFHPSHNDILASGCLGGEVRVWDLHGGCEVWSGERSSAIASIAFHPTDKVLVIATTNMIYFWNWVLAEPFAWCKTSSEKERVRFVRFDPYGHRLFTGIANIAAVFRQRDEQGRATSLQDQEQEENTLRERLLLLNEQNRQLLQRLRELQNQASGATDDPSQNTDSVDRPPSPTIVDALRMAREYAEMTSQNFSNLGSNIEPPSATFDREDAGSRGSSSSRSTVGGSRSEGPSRLSLQELQANLHSMRLRYTRICERLRELLLLRSRSAEGAGAGPASDANLVYSLLTFWREYETLAISLQHSSLQYGGTGEPTRDARRHIAVAMISLVQLQDMLHTSILRQMRDVSERGMARLIHSILMTLLELATLDTNILALRTTAMEAIGRTLHGQSSSSMPRPEARRQSGHPVPNLSQMRSLSVCLPRLNTASWPSLDSRPSTSSPTPTTSTPTPPLSTPSHLPSSTPRVARMCVGGSAPPATLSSLADSAFSQPRHLATNMPPQPPSSTSSSHTTDLPRRRHRCTPPNATLPRTTYREHYSGDTRSTAGTSVASPCGNSGGTRTGDNSNSSSSGANASSEPRRTASSQEHARLLARFTQLVGGASGASSTGDRSEAAGWSAARLAASNRRASAAASAASSSSQPSSNPSDNRVDSSGTGPSGRRIFMCGPPGSPRGIFISAGDPGEGSSTSSSSARGPPDPSLPNQQTGDAGDPSTGSTTEQLLRSILDELLNFLGSTSATGSSSAGTSGGGGGGGGGGPLFGDGVASEQRSAAGPSSSSSSSSSARTTAGGMSFQSSPNFPASWYPYWWNHIWNVHPPSGQYMGLSEPILVTKATFRIQCWDFTKFEIPDISNAQVNVVVPECLIQNDASIEISTDARLLATLVPSSLPTATLLAVHSLHADSFGQCLYLWSFGSSVISISLSPLARYVLVGLGSNRRALTGQGGKLIIGQVLQLVEGKDDKKEYLQHVRTVELRGENRFDVSLNSMRWLPSSGEGLIYGTNRGDLRICRPRACTDPWLKPSGQAPPSAPRRTYRDIVARVLFRRTNLPQHLQQPRPVVPVTNSTGTQTESDSDSG